MATYVYETIPSGAGGKTRQFEIKQSMNDAPLSRHPETGEPIRRVIVGGYGVMKSGSPAPHKHTGSCGCGSSCGC